MRTIAAIFLASLLLAMPRAPEAGDARVRFPQGDAYEVAPWLVGIEVVDAQQASPPAAPEIPGAAVRVLERGRQQSTQIINGRVSSSTSVTYAIEIVPEKAGTLQVPALEITVDGKPVRSQPRTVTVRRSDAADLLAAEIFGQPPEVNIGEPLELVLRIAIKPYADPNYGTLNEVQMWQFVDLKGSEWGIFEAEVAALAQREVRGAHVAQRDERERDHQLGDRQRVGAGLPPQADIARGHRRGVQHVDTGAQLGDDLELREPGDDRCRHRLQAHDGHVAAAQEVHQLVAVQASQRGVQSRVREQRAQFGAQRRVLTERRRGRRDAQRRSRKTFRCSVDTQPGCAADLRHGGPPDTEMISPLRYCGASIAT